MFKYKKLTIYTCTIMFVVFSFIELIKYLFCDNTLFGVYYLLVNLVIIFLLVPTAYNYKKYYSAARISKIILIIILGIINSFILEHIVIASMGYMDSTDDYIKSIFIYKNIFKGIIYLLLGILCYFEFGNEKVIDNKKRNISKKNLD